MTPSEELAVPVDAGGDRELVLRLRRYPAAHPESPRARERGAVLMLHGGNTRSDTFLLPDGGIARYLTERDCDVWLADWRTSPHVVDPLLATRPPLGRSERAERGLYTLSHAAREDVPRLLTAVRRRIGDKTPLSVVGHCMGGGVMSIAVALGLVAPFDVKSIVLSTLGLFYEVPWNGWLKAEDFMVERIPHESPRCRGIDPKHPEVWPEVMKHAYDRWPTAWLPPGGSKAARMLQRITFMFGQPYAAETIHPSIGDATLLEQFGTMHLGLFLHAAQLVRRGYAAEYDAPDVIDRPRLAARGSVAPVPGHFLVPAPFRRHRFTLLVAAENQLWHRDALDIMHDWLSSHQVATTKLVHPGYRIQDLFWGKRAEADVYPGILAAL
jgi:hypothetical protein